MNETRTARKPAIRIVTGITAAAACLGITGAFGYSLMHMKQQGAELSAATQLESQIESQIAEEQPESEAEPVAVAADDREFPMIDRMTDEMLLSLLAAFNRLGIPFDPDLLNARNCTRGYLENRSFSYEESERAKAIQRQVHRGMITKDSIPAGTFCQTVTVAADPEQAWGPFDNTLLRFVRYPYRSMTDDELAAYVLTTESAWETDPAAVEKLALDRVRSFLDVPLALTVTNEQMSVNPDGSKMYMNDFLIPYTDGITGRPASPAGKPMQILVCQLQPAGSDELKLVYIYVFYYFDNSGYDGEWPEFSREEWIAMGRREAEGIFRDLPEMEWDLADPESEEDNTVQVGAQSEGLYVDVQLHRWDGGCDVCFFSFGHAP